MTTERFMVDDCGTLIDMQTRDTFDYVSDVCGLLNKYEELREENKELRLLVDTFKKSNEDARHILKREFDFATEQRQKHLDEPVVATAYDIIRYDMRKTLDKLGWLE